MKTSQRFYGALALAALILVGCDGEPTTNPPTADVPVAPVPTPEGDVSEPCGLLSDDEIAAAVGAQVRRSESAEEGLGADRCTWTIDIDLAEVVTIVVYTQNARTLHEAGKVTPEGEPVPEIVAVPSIGEDAYYHKPLATLNVRRGDNAFFVQFVLGTRLGAKETRGGLEELAKKALARL